ncbi:hypothetical protein Sps_03967 [Shewanella psychrophila]|uniref:P pilus assembly protein, chaperone PapD n=1 Tax=Shewanella psychrophila TaxID=225848 RepID=A0A1S6HUC4_9GAMM|nr:hypothetical protein [Shewanella psychrophila]AQS39082.1 hypothetical protein Sps_03967 [Shewanella psychrophila]
MPNIKHILTAVFGLFISIQTAEAIQIDSMFRVADANSEGVFTVTNTDDKKLFLNIGITELTMVDGEIVKTPYTRDNIEQWALTVRPARSMIKPGFEKDFTLSLNCLPDCASDTDRVFQLAVVPTPYFDKGQRPDNAMQMAIGFAPIFVVPAKSDKLNYSTRYVDNQLEVYNKGNTFLNVSVSACKDDFNDTCNKDIKVLAGRRFIMELKPEMNNGSLELNVSTTDKKLKDTRVVIREANNEKG